MAVRPYVDGETAGEHRSDPLGDLYDPENGVRAGMMVGMETRRRPGSSVETYLGSGDLEKELRASEKVLNVSGPPKAGSAVTAEASYMRRQLVARTELRVDDVLKVVAD
ncbi:hypothetical protein MMC26_006709 [Xylographa opegraphella]|nr:hypothetical protein [Xylographa opegraphella]